MGGELKWLLKEGGGGIFESCDISLKNTPTSPHMQLVWPFFFYCACCDPAMPLLSCTCLRNNSNGACLPSCCRKAPFATTSFKKGGGLIFGDYSTYVAEEGYEICQLKTMGQVFQISVC